MQDVVIRKVSKGKTQHRVTLPKKWKSDYVAIKPIEYNVFKAKRKYYE